MTGLVCDIQRFSVQDGPGIRTTVFLQGCTLGCAWCHNPEGIPAQPVLMQTRTGEKWSSEEMDVREVLDVVLEDLPFYRNDGGLTVSGGEPLFQADFALELLRLARENGIHTALETAGQVPFEALERAARVTDLFLYDYKVTEDAARWIGAPTGRIVRNLRRLHDLGARILLRCPIIPGVNDNETHLRAIAQLLRDCPGILGVEMMAYHRLGLGKYKALGRENSLEALQPMAEDEKAAFLGQARDIITSHNVKWG